MSDPQLLVLDDPARALAERLAAVADEGGEIVLTGGSTPRQAYETAATLGADWSRARIWWGDERCVPPDDERSNFKLADDALLTRLDPAPRHVRIEGERGADDGAAHFAQQLQGLFGEHTPRFDLLVLGLGPDGHCASLFPGKPGITITDRLVTGVPEAGLEPFVPRISMTLPLLNAAREVVFLVTGEGKADAARRAFGPEPDLTAPSAHVRPDPGTLTVLLDRAAAAKLPAA